MKIVTVADERTAATEVLREEGTVAVVYRSDYAGEGGWSLVISTAEVLAEIGNRLANFRPLNYFGHKPPAVSVLATPKEVEEVLR